MYILSSMLLKIDKFLCNTVLQRLILLEQLHLQLLRNLYQKGTITPLNKFIKLEGTLVNYNYVRKTI